MKRKVLTFLFCTILLIPMGAWAQQDGDGPRPGDGPRDGDRPRPGDPQTASLRAIIQFLELSEEQVRALVAFQRERGEQLQPFARALGENARAMQEALRSDAPDPTLVGQLTLDAQRIRRELQEAIQQQREGAPAALNLSPDQTDQLGVLQTSLRVAPIAGLAAGLNLIEGPAIVGGVFGGFIGAPGFIPPSGPGFVEGDFSDIPMMSRDMRDMARERAEEFQMRFEGLETEVNRIGVNVDRVSLRVGVIPIRADSE